MGNVKQGILGGISGKVGNVVGFRRNGKDLLRVRAASVNDAHTPKQVKQRKKVMLIMDFLKPLLLFSHRF